MSRAPKTIKYHGQLYKRADSRVGARITPEFWRERVQQMFDALKLPKPKRIKVDLGITPRYPLVQVIMADEAAAESALKIVRRRGWRKVERHDAVIQLALNPDWPMVT
jgi:hypothetical protein